FQGLICVAIPGLGPIKEIAKQLAKHAEVLEKSADALVELTKGAIENVKKQSEFTEAQDDKARANSLSIKFFAEQYTKVSQQANAVPKMHNSLSKYLTSGETAELAIKVPAARTAWTKSGWERPDDDDEEIQADQLALLFLYDIMRQYCKSCVTLRGLNMEVPL